jgi:hypothetical protein
VIAYHILTIEKISVIQDMDSGFRVRVHGCGCAYAGLPAGHYAASNRGIKYPRGPGADMNDLQIILKVATAERLDKTIWPGSIAIPGPGSPKHFCPQKTSAKLNTVYGISKRAGEYGCQPCPMFRRVMPFARAVISIDHDSDI